jgi:hypothetical protein
MALNEQTAARVLPEYVTLSAEAEQSEEILASQKKFSWKWSELPDFPLSTLLPQAAETLFKFPENTALGMLVLDVCVDVLSKMKAMDAGVVNAICAVASAQSLVK